MNGDERTDPYGRHRFAVAVDGRPPLGFTEVRGLRVRVETDRTDESADEDRDGPRLRRPGDRIGRHRGTFQSSIRRRAASPTLTLRRGVTDDRSLWDWLRDWVDGSVSVRDVRVVLLDERGEPARGWVCRDARPVEWRGPELVAGRPAVATETLELAHEGLEAMTDAALASGVNEW